MDKQASEQTHSKRSPMDTCNPRGVTGALLVSWKGIEYLMGIGIMEERVNHRNSHLLDVMQQRKLIAMRLHFRMRLVSVPIVLVLLAAGAGAGAGGRRSRHPKSTENRTPDISLWIDERQVRMFSGISMQVYAIVHGNVSPYILDPNFSHKLPIIPSEVGYVNFTWKAGSKFYYHFDTLTSSDPKTLKPPVLSIKTKGRVPKRAKEFSIFLPCMGNNSGVATFEIGLKITNGKGEPLKGTPLRLNLKKECAQRGVYFARTGPDPECDKKCANQGWCNEEKICQCPEGYMGQYCRTALCYPQCMNGGNCTAPGQCSCPPGYQGRHCEGGE
ncbi:Protein shifted [Eumeta japonica]|uniref:Protein shifted n=1 Tax=Eumeta variegata TaxID=151549 RepID=A0A4C1WNR9_EUMVA|nr:Protein shifted [Eumeta japonica]